MGWPEELCVFAADGPLGYSTSSKHAWTHKRLSALSSQSTSPALKRPARPSGRRSRGGRAAGAATAHRCGSTSRCDPAGSRRAPRCGTRAAPAQSSVPRRSAASAAAQRQPAPQHMQHVSHQCSLCRVVHIMYLRGISQATLCCIG